MGVGRREARIGLKTSPPPALGRARLCSIREALRGDESCTLISEGQEGEGVTTEVAEAVPSGAQCGKVLATWDIGPRVLLFTSSEKPSLVTLSKVKTLHSAPKCVL